MIKLKYIPQIDGLRAIAVLAVVFYHANIEVFGHKILQGGFLGVDIFFVISGYLISKLIFLELSQTNNFSFKNFYLRRAKRILPVVIFVILALLILSYFILAPNDLMLFSESIIYQLFFLSNFNFWFYYHFGYMTEDALMLPLLHTWSLSLEEQFYFFLPIVLVFLFKNIKNKFFIILNISFLFFLLLSHFGSLNYKSLSFYMLPFRVWEFLIGIIIAYIDIFFKTKINIKKNLVTNSFLVNTSFLIIFLYLFFFGNTFQHPSLYTFFLVFSVSIIIFNSDKSYFVNDLLSSNILRKIGLISYSLYLWHYPLFSFFRHIYGNSFENFILLKLLIIAASFLLSFFSYFLIEKKFRKPEIKIAYFVKFILVMIFSILIISFLIFYTNGFKSRLNLTTYQTEILKTAPNHSIINKSQKSANINKKNVLIIGNSHGRDFYSTLTNNEILNNKYNLRYFSTQTHCLKDIFVNYTNRCLRTFNRNQETINQGIKDFKSSEIIVLKTRWYKESILDLEETIKFLLASNKKIVIVSRFPEFLINEKASINDSIYANSIPKKIFYREKLPLEQFILDNNRFPNNEEIKKIEKEYYELLNIDIENNNKFLEKISRKYNLTYLDDFSLICNSINKTCLFSDTKNNIIHLDTSGHTTINGGRFLSNLMVKENWFKLD